MPLLAVIGCALLVGGVTALLVAPAWVAARGALDAANSAFLRCVSAGGFMVLAGGTCLWLTFVAFMMGARG